jgi:hypothetical protein
MSFYYNLEKLQANFITRDGKNHFAEGIHVIEAIMLLCPQLLEGQRMRWARHAWAVHNLIGHPLMQLLAFFGAHRTALWVHDITVPKPR